MGPYLSLYKNMTERIVHSPSGLSGVWPYYRADDLPWGSSTSVTLFCSCMFPASFCGCCLSASKMLPRLANLTDFNLFFVNLFGYPHLCETCPDIPLSILSWFCSYRYAFINYVCIMCQVNKIDMVPVLAKLTI